MYLNNKENEDKKKYDMNKNNANKDK